MRGWQITRLIEACDIQHRNANAQHQIPILGAELMTTDRSGKRIATACCGGCGTLFVLLGIAIAVRWGAGIKTPSLVVPPKPLAPSPNGFDTYRSAAQLLVNTNKVGDAIGAKPTVSFTSAQKAALVNSNSAALKMLRSGFSQEYYDTTSRSFFAQSPHYAQFRAMARLLSLEGMVRAQRGDWTGAVQSQLDCMRMGEEIPRGGPLIGELVGIACQAIGRRNLWSYMDHLDASQTRRAIKQVLAMEQSRVPYADTLLEEKYMQMSALNMMFKSNSGMSAAFGGPQNGGPPLALAQFMYLVYSKETIARNNQTYFDQLIANARRSYGEHLAEPPTPSDPINQILMPVFAQARIKDVEDETQNGLVCVMMALHAYKLQHGKYPRYLADLTPSYIAAMPPDPFAPKGTFQYHLEGGKFVLYSIGPDGKDDGGKPIDDPSKSANGNNNARYFVDANSKGDIVAGKNTW